MTLCIQGLAEAVSSKKAHAPLKQIRTVLNCPASHRTQRAAPGRHGFPEDYFRRARSVRAEFTSHWGRCPLTRYSSCHIHGWIAELGL